MKKTYYTLVKHKNYYNCCKKCMKPLESEEQGKLDVLKSCRQIISERLDLANYLHDGMDFHIIRQNILKSRHRMLTGI